MSEPPTKETPTYAFGTGVWVKVLHRIWWPGIVVDPLTTPQELDLVNNGEHIAVVKFEQENKYEVVGINDEILLYTCDRKIEFVEKGLSSLKKQKKGVGKTDRDINHFKNDIIYMERVFGGDVCIFEHLEEKQKTLKSLIKQFTQTNNKRSKKKKGKRKSLPAPEPVSKPRTSTQSKVNKTYRTVSNVYCCSQVDCKFITSRHIHLERHMALIHKSSTNLTSNESSILNIKLKVKKCKKVSNEVEDHRESTSSVPREVFEDYCPGNRPNSRLLVNQDNSSTHAWIASPAEIEPAEITIPHTLTAPANQMGSTKSRSISSLINNTDHIVLSPPLVCVNNIAPVIGNTVSQLNTLRNVGPTVIVPATEIHLTSPPSTSGSPTVQENSHSYKRELTRIPMRARETSSHAYIIKLAKLEERTIHCINAKPYKYSNWMVTLDDLVQTVFPSCTVKRCAELLEILLKTKTFYGNSEQLAVLRENGRIRSVDQGKTPMASLRDIMHVLPKLKKLHSSGLTSTTKYRYLF